MRILFLILLFSLTAVFQVEGQSALLALKSQAKPRTAMTRVSPKHVNKKKGLNSHQRPEQVAEELHEGFDFLENEDYAEAITFFSDSYEEDADAAFGLGLAYYQDHQPLEAITYFELAVELDEENTDALYLLGLLYAEMGDLEAATDALFSLLLLDEEDADAWYLLGFVYYVAGYEETAYTCLQEAARYDAAYREEGY